MGAGRVIVIIQARMGSTRLPGKVLRKLADRSVLAHVIERCKRIPKVTDIVVATSNLADDLQIADEARKQEVPFFCGSEHDVLARFMGAAQMVQAQATDAIVRVTSDCPLLDWEVSGDVVGHFLNHSFDYCSNTQQRTYPRGLDTEVFTMQALQEAYDEATTEAQREHVTPFIYQQAQRYRLGSVESSIDYSAYRWTLDTKEDWLLMEAMYQELYVPGSVFSWSAALELMRRRPELQQMNAHIEQKKV